MRDRKRRPRAAALGWATAAAAAGSVALSAQAHAALPAPGSVRAGHNVSVFHEIDFVATFGHQVGTPLRIEVLRGPHVIARAAGNAVSTPEGGGLEVNHGVELASPGPGDCWANATADIKPYDRIVVTDAAGGTDTILVDDIAVDEGPVADAADPDDVVLRGHARSALGGPVTSALEGEFRLTSKLRGEPDHIDVAGEQFTAVYTPPYRMRPDKGGFATKAQLLDPAAEHTIGFGHTLPFATGETQIADAVPAPGPALGCEGVAPAAPDANAATAVDRDEIGPGAGLTVSGTATAAVAGVAVTLDDGPGGAAPVEAATTDLAAGEGAPAGADRAWTVAFTPEQLATFPADAELTATPAFTGGGAATAPAIHVHRDTLAPATPRSDPAPGRYEGAQYVGLLAEAGATIRFTTDGSTPTAASRRFGGAFRVDRTTTIRAIAIDAAGNASPVATLAFEIVAPGSTATGGVAPALAPAVGPAPAAVVPLPAVALVARPAPAALRVARLSAPSRLSARRARRTGVTASFVVPTGAQYAEARLYRLAGGRRALVTRMVFATPRGRERARFTSTSVRRALRPGRFVLEVRTGTGPTRLGPAVVRALRITR